MPITAINYVHGPYGEDKYHGMLSAINDNFDALTEFLQSGALYNAGNGIDITSSVISVEEADDFSWAGQHQWSQSLWGPVGSAAAPAFSFASDQDTGIYSLGDNNFGFAVGGAGLWDINGSRVYHGDIYVHVDRLVGDVETKLIAQFSAKTDSITTPTDIDSIAVYGWDTGAISGLSTPYKGVQLDFVKASPGIALGDNAGDIGFRFRMGGFQNSGTSVMLQLFAHYESAAGTEIFRVLAGQQQLLIPDGSALNPSIAFINDESTGIYRNAGTGRIQVTAGGGASGFSADPSGFIRISPVAYGNDGSAAAPMWSFNSDSNTGMYRSTTDTLGFSAGGTLRLSISTSQIVGTLPYRGPNGSVTAPAFSFDGDSNTGMYTTGTSGNLSFASDGAIVLGMGSTTIHAYQPIRVEDGAVGTPSYSFHNDQDTGFYRISADLIGVATGGAERWRWNSVGAVGIGGANYGTSGQVLKSAGSGASVAWGTVGPTGIDLTAAYAWTGQHTMSVGPTITGAVSILGASRTFIDFASGRGRFGALGANATDLPTGFRLYLFSSDASVSKAMLEAACSGGGITGITYGNSTDYPANTMYGALTLTDAASGAAVAQSWRKGAIGIDTPFVTGFNVYYNGGSMALGTQSAHTLTLYSNSTARVAINSAGGITLSSGLSNYADDAAAALGGIAVGQLYRNGSVVMIRVA